MIIIEGGQTSATVQIGVRNTGTRARIVRATAVESDRYTVSRAGRNVVPLRPR